MIGVACMDSKTRFLNVGGWPKAEAQKQKATFGSPFCRQDTALIPFAAERHQQAEQVDE